MLIDETQEPYLAHLRSEDVIAINDYISDPATATTVHTFGPTQSRGRQIVTSEVLYFQMFSRQIPIECQHWHINRFMMLLRVWDAYNADPKTGKMSRKQTAAMYARENARRQRLLSLFRADVRAQQSEERRDCRVTIQHPICRCAQAAKQSYGLTF